jgi:hypothetical protein
MLMASQLGQRGAFLVRRDAVWMTTLDASAAGAAR